MPALAYNYAPRKVEGQRKSEVKLPDPTCEKYLPLVEKYDWDPDVAMRVMYAESGCQPTAYNAKDQHKTCVGSSGLMQIDCTYGKLFNPEENIRVAYFDKYLKGGWYRHWGPCITGKIKCGPKV